MNHNYYLAIVAALIAVLALFVSVANSFRSVNVGMEREKLRQACEALKVEVTGKGDTWDTPKYCQ